MGTRVDRLGAGLLVAVFAIAGGCQVDNGNGAGTDGGAGSGGSGGSVGGSGGSAGGAGGFGGSAGGAGGAVGGSGGAGGDIGDDACAQGCLALDDCDQCLPDDNDECLSPADCADACRQDGDTAPYECLAALDTCDEAAIGACFDGAGPGDDACGRGCQKLDDCELCIPDDNGDCLSPSACADACRAADDAASYDCIGALDSCDQAAIDACAGGGDVGDDDCAHGCLAIDACDLCITDDNDECLSVADCAQACRDAGEQAVYACAAEVQMCDEDALNGCFETGAPDCQATCQRVVECSGDMNPDAALAQCVAACQANDDPDARLCVAEAADCAAVAACAGGHPGDPEVECDRACSELEACGLALPAGMMMPPPPGDGEAGGAGGAAGGAGGAAGGAGGAMGGAGGGAAGAGGATGGAGGEMGGAGGGGDAGHAACVAQCLGGLPQAPRQCLAAAATCDVAMGCLAPPPPADCNAACARLVGCVPAGPEAMQQCLEGCAAQATPDQLACVATAPDCDAAVACVSGDMMMNPPPDPQVQAECTNACNRLAMCTPVAPGDHPAPIGECVDGCVAESTPEERQCVLGAPDCDGVQMCFAQMGGGPVDPQVQAECQAACQRLDQCSMMDPGAGIPPLDQCEEGCIAESTPEQRQCVLQADACDAIMPCIQGSMMGGGM
jgi:hypothetical protein